MANMQMAPQHSAQLDAAGGWPAALAAYRSARFSATRPGNAQSGRLWGSNPQSNRVYMGVPLAAVYHQSRAMTPTQQPVDLGSARHAALMAALRASMSNLYAQQGGGA